jgi:hypothetical protein
MGHPGEAGGGNAWALNGDQVPVSRDEASTSMLGNKHTTYHQVVLLLPPAKPKQEYFICSIIQSLRSKRSI